MSRIDYYKEAPEAVKALASTRPYFAQSSSIEQPLRHLLDLRVSQINGCSYCIALHLKEARDAGETQQKLDLLSVWREVPHSYSERERAALEWAEAVTCIRDGHAPDAVFDRVLAVLSEKEVVDVTMLVAVMNAWNRIAISMRQLPGS